MCVISSAFVISYAGLLAEVDFPLKYTTFYLAFDPVLILHVGRIPKQFAEQFKALESSPLIVQFWTMHSKVKAGSQYDARASVAF